MNRSFPRSRTLLFCAVFCALAAPSKASVYLELANNGDTIEVAQGGSFQVTLNLTSTLEEVVGLEYFVQMPGVLDNYFILAGRDLSGSVFSAPILENPEVLALPGAILDPRNTNTLGAWTGDFSPVGAGMWQVAVLTIAVNAVAPTGSYQFDTFSLPNEGWFDGGEFEPHGFDAQGFLNVEVVAVPEPAAGMLLLGGIGLLALARRRKAGLLLAPLAAICAAVLFPPSAEAAEDMSDYAKYLEYRQIFLPNGNGLNYRIAPPRNYEDDGRKYPLVIFWHGNGDFDWTGFVAGDPTKGNDRQVTQDGQSVLLSLENQAVFPCYLVLMQRRTKNGDDRDTEAFCAALVDELIANRNVDPDRVIITGLSGGGGRTLACAYANPDKYAAIVPLSTISGGTNDDTALAAKIKDIPAWFFHAANDRTVNVSSSDAKVRALRRAGGRPIYTRLDGGDHSPGLWQANYATPALVPWLAAQRRGQSSQQDPARVLIQWPTSDPTIMVSNTNVSFVGRLEVENPDGSALDPLVTTISGTKITSSTSAIPLAGLDPWAAAAGTVSVNATGTTALIAVARGRSWSTLHQGYTYYSDTLLASYSAGGDAVAPAVQITSPTTQGLWITRAGSLTLAGTAADAAGVKAVEWSSNRGGLGAATGTTAWSAAAVPLVTGTNVLTVTARDAAGNLGQQSLTVIREGALPPDNSLWTGSDIGNTGAAGNFVESSGTITIQGSGSGMWGTDNNYYFVHQPVQGDTILIARILSQEGSPSGENYAGWFISETVSSTSRYFFSGFAGGSRGVMRLHWNPLDTYGGSQTKAGLTPPYFIGLERKGNSFSSYVSATGTGAFTGPGTDWMPIDTTQNVGMGQAAYAGFVVGSARTGVLTTVVFDRISITNGTAPIQVSAASRMTHGAAGDFDLDLPLAGTTGVESRRGATPGTLSIRLVFDRPLASGAVTVSGGVATVSGTPAASGNALVVNLTGVADGQTVTLNATNVLSLGSALPGAGKATFRVLSGDTNASGNVTTADAAKVRANANQPLAAGNFGCDIDASGAIDAGDFALAKARLGTSLP